MKRRSHALSFVALAVVCTLASGAEVGPIHHSGVIDTNEVWHPSGNPHILDADVWTGNNVTLTIMPACTVQLSFGAKLYTGLGSAGSIVAVGKADSVIVFTALSDTSPGFWDYIGFHRRTFSTARMSYCSVLFGGQTSTNSGAVKVESTSIKFDHNLVRKSGSNGVWATSTGYFGDFTNNTITACAKYAVHVSARYVSTLGAGNVLTGNTKDGIEVAGSWVDASGTWLNHGVRYVVTSDVRVEDDATLTIEAGCTIALGADVEFYCGYASSGSIVAVGAAVSPITFTGAVDTVAGVWSSLSFYPNTISTARLSYVTVECAGSGSSPDGAVYVYGCGIRMDHCTVRKNAMYGVCATSNGYFPDFSNNTISTSGQYPVKIQAEFARTLGTGNTLAGNTKDGILITGQNVKTSGTWLNHGVPYVTDGDIAISDAANTPVLTIAAGTKLMLRPGTEFYVGYAAPGGLIADGTAGQIEFTSSTTPPSPGDWVGLSFYDQSISSQCRLISCKVEYGGDGDYGNIHIRNCTPEVRGDSIGHSSAWGIYLRGAEYPDPESLLANNTFYDCAAGRVYFDGMGVGDRSPAATWRVGMTGTIRGNVITVTDVSGRARMSGVLLDAGGRKVLDLRPGTNDVRSLAPGVYFVRQEPHALSSKPEAVRKIVLTN